MFFGPCFSRVGIYRYQYAEAFEKASERLNWQIGGINTLVLLVSSLTMVLAVYYAKLGDRRRLIRYLLLTAAIGTVFLVLKGLEYYIDYRENLIPGWRFDPSRVDPGWVVARSGSPVKLFLLMYFVMTAIHGVHLTIGIIIVLILATLAKRGAFTSEYYSPIDVTGLYWHFVDIVWIFLLPLLYLMGTHTLGGGRSRPAP